MCHSDSYGLWSFTIIHGLSLDSTLGQQARVRQLVVKCDIQGLASKQ